VRVSRLSRRARSCDAARFAASLELDGALDEVGRRDLRRHVRRCPECARVVSEMQSTSALLRRSGGVRFRCELAGERLVRTCSTGLGRLWAGAAVAVAALVLATGALPHSDGGAAPSPRAAAVVTPRALPIGQRSAMDDFAARPATTTRTS
jgi:Putative zinc-finger